MQVIWSVIVLLGLAALLAVADRKATRSGITVKVLGKSGKIQVARGRSADDETKKGVFTINFDELKELDAKEKEVGKSGKIKHSINGFQHQNFTFSPLVNTTLQNIDVSMFTFESSLRKLTSNIKVYVYIINENGQLNVAGDTIDVKKGQMKFSIELSNWEWCPSNCSPSATGAFIDFTIELKCRGKIKKKERKNRKIKDSADEYELGDDAEFRANARMERWTNGTRTFVIMPAGYPQPRTKGPKQLFTFRFPRFTGTMVYDPVMALGPEPGSGVARVAVYPAVILITALLALGAVGFPG